MKSTEIARLANNFAEMLKDDHTLGEITENLLNKVMDISPHQASEEQLNQAQLDVCHVLKVMYDNLKREMIESVKEWEEELSKKG